MADVTVSADIDTLLRAANFAAARTALVVAGSGANSDLTAISGLTGLVTDTQNALGGNLSVVGNTTGVGLFLTNTTAAANNAQQASPTLRFRTNAWSTGLSASQIDMFDMGALGIQGSSATTAALRIRSSIAGGGLTDSVAIFGSGTVSTTTTTGTMVVTGGGAFSGALNVGGNISGAGTLTITGGNIVTNSGLGLGTNQVWMVPVSSGVAYISDNTFAAFTRLGFGFSTNSHPAIGRDAVNGLTFQSAAGTATWNDASTAGSGTVANRYMVGIAAPTLTATNSSVTNTVASTVYIGGPPTDSTNTTSTTKWALNVAAGNVNLGGTTVFGATARLKGYTVATLPAGVQGDTAFVTDALTPAFLVTVAGGGAVVTTVFYNGSNWISQ